MTIINPAFPLANADENKKINFSCDTIDNIVGKNADELLQYYFTKLDKMEVDPGSDKEMP